ncbi:hypothetical protein Taro_043251 [Colocasia esculenta]|uniref:O-fucosyltransferase family protein n=1 Tax=Colocasia esculenta TaxID=4460 RepID=A0A843WV75_COLES|nr:hypothetical protein [Colocasia esculenta]
MWEYCAMCTGKPTTHRDPVIAPKLPAVSLRKPGAASAARRSRCSLFLAFVLLSLLWACVNLFGQLALPPLPSSCIRRHLQLQAAGSPKEGHLGWFRTGELPGHGSGMDRPCLNFSEEYRQRSAQSRGGRRWTRRGRFLIAVVSGGLNQQRNQIVDAVVIARILDAALVLPVLQVNRVWGDESEFSDIFDERRFKRTLADDVKVISTLPSSHLGKRPAKGVPMPFGAGEAWVRAQYMRKLDRSGILLIRDLDSRLSKRLNPDLQKLRCKVAFQALRFRPWIEEIGESMARRMSEQGPYVALHLRLEKDVWVRTGCSPGLGEAADRAVTEDRASHPELLTSRSSLTPHERYLAGLCPLNATELSILLRGVGMTRSTRIYWAGGEPFGGEEALRPLTSSFSSLLSKWSLARPGELDGLVHRPSVLGAIDYIVCLRSGVFLANHGGNMAKALQGHRAFMGYSGDVVPKKRLVVHLLQNKSLEEDEIKDRLKRIHVESWDLSTLKTREKGGDAAIVSPIPGCMCTL